MSFRFSLGRAQVKHFKTALQTLNKIGGELLVEAVPHQLVLRSINSAKSAFLSVTYFSRFFDSYEIYDTAVVQTVLLSKNAIAIFRSPKIKHIEFMLDNAAARLLATVHTDEGLVKRYSFNCLDGEVLQATVDRDAYPTVVVAEASELEKILSSFQHTLEEITLIANPLSTAALANGHKACEIRSFMDPLKGGQELALLTSLTLDTRSVFTSYTHRSPLAADVTFNVKDFRAMTALCTALGADVALRLEVAGAPLVVEPHFRGLREGAETDFQAMLVLSTLTDSQLGPEHLAQRQALQEEEQQQQQEEEQQHQNQHEAVHAPPVQQQLPQRADQQQQKVPVGGTDRKPRPLNGRSGDGAYGSGAQDGALSGRAGRKGLGGGSSSAGTGTANALSRRRLPQHQNETRSAATGAAATAARGVYATAAAAEGLPVAGGEGGSGGDARQAAQSHLRLADLSAGAVGSGVNPVSITLDGPEDDIPSRRTARPPRYDHISHHRPGSFSSMGLGVADGDGDCNLGAAGGAPWVADPSLLRPPAGLRLSTETSVTLHQGFGHIAENVAPHQQAQPRQWPSDPRVTGAAGLLVPPPPPYDPHPQYLHFPRVAGPRHGDSQDPEILPGARSPYARRGQAQAVAVGAKAGGALAAAKSVSLRSYSVADPRVVITASNPSAQGPWIGVASAEGVGAGALPGSQADIAGHTGAGVQEQDLPSSGQAVCLHPGGIQPDPRLAADNPQQDLHSYRQPQVEADVNHEELFGEDEGLGGAYDVAEYDVDDEDEEVPMTPPDQQQTRSMGAGVLGMGGAAGA